MALGVLPVGKGEVLDVALQFGDLVLALTDKCLFFLYLPAELLDVAA